MEPREKNIHDVILDNIEEVNDSIKLYKLRIKDAKNGVKVSIWPAYVCLPRPQFRPRNTSLITPLSSSCRVNGSMSSFRHCQKLVVLL
jgi:hypothetical protein